MQIVHLLASPFLGGPERQVVGLAEGHTAGFRTAILSFAEGGRARPFLEEARRRGFEACELTWNHPRLRAATREVAEHLVRLRADVLCCAGYKPDLVGWLAARRVGIPAVAVAHGWTAATLKVRVNEWLDRRVMQRMDAVVCVSEGQAVKVRQAGVSPEKIHVIRNAVQTAPFENPDPQGRDALGRLFPRPPGRIVGAVGRLSPEKGFEDLVAAAAIVLRTRPDTGFIQFGDGPSAPAVRRRIAELDLEDRFVLAGFRDDVHRFVPHFDVSVLPSYTEGLPVVVLEALACGVPVVATAVGGTPEAVDEGRSGFLVPPGQPEPLAERILTLLGDDDVRTAMGAHGRARVMREFTFDVHARQYERLFAALLARRSA